MTKAFHPDGHNTGRIILTLIVFIVFSLIESSFATTDNVFTALEGFAFTGLAALAIGITIIAGEMDLSVGSIAAVAAAIAVSLADTGIAAATLLAVFVSAIIGLLQGVAIGFLRIPSIVFTLGTMIGLRGLVYILTGEKSVTVQDLNKIDIINNQFFVFSLFSVVAIAAFVLVDLFMKFTQGGRNIYAIGGGRSEAAAAGVPVFLTTVFVFTLSGMLAGIAGSLAALKSGSAAPHFLEDLLLLAAASALIGGASLSGGQGTAFGIALGVIMIRFVSNLITFKTLPNYVENLAIGALLIIVIAVEIVITTPRAKSAITHFK